jgi:CRP/FNR family transcriptional regulator, cyclic AMP receptor protein
MSSCKVIGHCMDCPVRGSSRLCDVPDDVLQDISARKQQASYPVGSILYREGEPCRRAFIICQGEVRLTRTSADGNRAILKIAKSGELLGISEAVGSTDYVATAEVLEEASIACLDSEQLIRLMERHSVAGTRISQFLSSECLNAFVDVCLLRQTSCATVKLGQFMLRWAETRPHCCDQWIPLPYTHSDIAQLLGASRETVTRLLGSLQKKRVLQMKRARFRVIDLAALRELASGAAFEQSGKITVNMDALHSGRIITPRANSSRL